MLLPVAWRSTGTTLTSSAIDDTARMTIGLTRPGAGSTCRSTGMRYGWTNDSLRPVDYEACNGLVRKDNAKENSYSLTLRSRHFRSLARSSRNCGMSVAMVDSKAGGVSTANMGHCPASLYFRIMLVRTGCSGL